MRKKNASGIYLIRNIVNDKVYIGSSQNVRMRINGHLCDLRAGLHHNIHLQASFDKYGEDNFKAEPIEYVPVDQLEDRETYWIKKMKSHINKYGYNIRIYVTNNRGLKHTDETKKRISEAKKGVKLGKYSLTEEERMRRAESMRSAARSVDEAKRLEAVRKATTGVNNVNAKLTPDDVREIRELLKTGLSKRDIAEIFGISTGAVYNIANGRTWSHVI